MIGLLVIGHSSIYAQYEINDVFSDLNETTYVTQDIFAVWWDKDFDYTAQASSLLDDMVSYKEACINEYGLQLPQSPIDGYYVNVYLHGDGGFYDMYGWGNGLGTDTNGYPYLTLPYWIISDNLNTAHETFHVFQHNASSPGFAYTGDSQWYTEATANWFAAIQNIELDRAFIESEALVRIPHVPLWLGWSNFPSSYPNNWQRQVHQYGLGLFIYYLTDVKDVSRLMISEGYYTGTTLYPQEYLFNNIGGEVFRGHFIDWATQMTNDFDFITQTQRDANLQEWNTYADPNDDNEFIAVFDENGSQGWYRPDDLHTTNAWSFNTYKLNNSSNTQYTFELSGDPSGSQGDPAYFKARVLVRNNTQDSSYFVDVPMSSDWDGSLTLPVSAQEDELFFIVASMPNVFEDNGLEFQLFNYEIRIANGTLGQDDNAVASAVEVYPNPVKDILHVSVPSGHIRHYELISVMGQTILSSPADDNPISVDMGALRSGVYFLKMQLDTGARHIRVIKQ